MSESLVVWIFQSGEPLPIDPGHNRPMRAMNLTNALLAQGHRVVLWSADFDHINKRFRNQSEESIKVQPELEIRLLPSTGYQRNVGFARLFDHVTLAINLKKRLRQEPEKPDVVFVGYPPIETAYVLTRWCRAKHVPTLLDIKDQWPLIFSNALPKPLQPLGSFLLYPYTCLARRTMRSASALSAMAEGFLDWAISFCGKSRSDNDRVFPLTTPVGQIEEAEFLAACDWWDALGVTDAETCRLSFVGSFSPAFDFLSIRLAAEASLKQGREVQFVLCGDGGNADQVKAMMSDLPNVLFPGWIDRPKIEALAGRCIASIAPYRSTPDFRLSIPNKVVDSLSLGLPVLSPLQGEVASLIDNHIVGLRYDDAAGTAEQSLYQAIVTLSEDKKLQKTLSSNALDLYNARFSFERVYGDLVAHLEKLAT